MVPFLLIMKRKYGPYAHTKGFSITVKGLN